MVDMWNQFLEYVQHKGVPMSEDDWKEEAMAFSGGNLEVACYLMCSLHEHLVIFSLLQKATPGEA